MNKELIIKQFGYALTKERQADIILNPYKYIGLHTFKSECKVEIWKQGKQAVVLFTDLGIGTSVTNASEKLVTEIYNLYLSDCNPNECLFAETYDKTEAIDVIVPTWKGFQVIGVDWFHLGKIIK